MEIETTLARQIDSAGLSASYDAACKCLLANKVILAWIMKSCIAEYAETSVKDIAENCIEGHPQIAEVAVNPDEAGGTQICGMPTEDSSIHEGTVTYDIRFRAVVPVSGEPISLIINIEAQNDFYPGYPLIKRAIYYCSRMISSQYETEFTGAHYEKIKKVYSIWICMNPPKKRKNSINRYSVKEEALFGTVTEKQKNYDLLTAVIVCLGNSNDQTNEIIRLLDVLLTANQEPDDKKRILRDEFSIEMTKELEGEVSNMCNLSKGVIEAGLAQGIAQGLAQGTAQGLAQGTAQGLTKGLTISIANLMESMNLSAEEAMNALKIPVSDRPQYLQLLKESQKLQ